MTGANAFAWAYPAQGFAGTIPHTSDTAITISSPTLAPASLSGVAAVIGASLTTELVGGSRTKTLTNNGVTSVG